MSAATTSAAGRLTDAELKAQEKAARKAEKARQKRIALFTIVATWNNYFLPLIMLKDADWYPLTIGLNQWKDQASTAGGQAIQNLVITGSLITIIPLVIAFLCLQKYWQSGLAAGAVKE